MALIQVTESASERIRDLLGKEGKLDTHGLRLKVVGGGCSGLRYELAFDDRFKDGDTTLDFVDTLQESGFKMVNPNAKTTCGCGESFGA